MGSWWEQEAEALALPCDPVLSAPRQHGLTRPPLTRGARAQDREVGQSGSPAPASWSCSPVIGQAAPSGSLSLQKEPRAKMGAGVRLRKLQGTVQAGAASSAPGPDLEPPASTWLTATLLLPSPQAGGNWHAPHRALSSWVALGSVPLCHWVMRLPGRRGRRPQCSVHCWAPASWLRPVCSVRDVE